MTNDLGAFVASEVARAEQDFQNVRSRAVSLTGISGTIVALASGLLAIAVHSSSTSTVPTDAKYFAGVSLIIFVLSTLCALLVNKPFDVQASDTEGKDGLRDLVDSDWGDSGWDQRVSQFLVEYLKSLRKANKFATRWLTATIALQSLGMATLVISVVLLLKDAA
jgi:hypothetical protein